jgi:hypothetical protein
MATHKRTPEEQTPLGPEGVPVDAPDNDAPAISPHAVSRVHRAEDDPKAFEHSPDFSDDRTVADDRSSSRPRDRR